MHVLGIHPRPLESVVCVLKSLSGILMHAQFKHHDSRNSGLCFTWLNKAFSSMVLGNSTERPSCQVAFLTILTGVHAFHLLSLDIISISQFFNLSYHIVIFHLHVCELREYGSCLIQLGITKCQLQCQAHG